MPAEPAGAVKALLFSFPSILNVKIKAPSRRGFSAVGFGSLLFNKAFDGKPVLS